MQIEHKKNTAYYLAFPAVSSSTPETFATGLSPVDTAYYKDGAGAWTSLSIADTASQIGGTGVYEINLTAGEMNHDQVLIKFAVSGMADTAFLFDMRTKLVSDLNDFNATSDTVANVGATASVTDPVTVGTINAGVITATSIAGDAITEAKIADNAIASEHLAATAISEIVNGVLDEDLTPHVTLTSTAVHLKDTLADTNELQGDWVNGGRLDQILDGRMPTTHISATGGTVDTVTTTDNLTNLPTMPANWITAIGITDSALTAAKFAANSLDGKGDWNTTVPLSAAQTQTEVDLALKALHLDHLLAADYDPAAKPGNATALFNELIENDGAGVSRYTAGALAQAPSGGGDATAANQSTIIGHLTDVKGAGWLAADNLAEIAEDVNDLQTNQGNWVTAVGFSTHSAADVWTAGSRTLSSAANITSDGSAITMSAAGVVGNVNAVATTTTNSDMRGTDNAFLAASAPANFGNLAISAGTGYVTVGGFLGGTLTETTGGRIAGNFDTFFENADAATTQTVDDVGGAGGGASVADIWNALTATYAAPGSMGEALGAAGTAGDPWTTPLPGTYAAGQAGNIVGAILTSEHNATQGTGFDTASHSLVQLSSTLSNILTATGDQLLGEISVPISTSGLSLLMTAQRDSDGYWWDDAAGQFAAAPSFADRSITMTEGTGQYVGVYTGTFSVPIDLGAEGSLSLFFHDDNDANDAIVATSTISDARGLATVDTDGLASELSSQISISGAVAVNNAVGAGGYLDLIIGNDYLATEGTDLQWVLPETEDALGDDVRLEIRESRTGRVVISHVAGTVTEADGIQTISVDLSGAMTSVMEPANLAYRIDATSPAGAVRSLVEGTGLARNRT